MKGFFLFLFLFFVFPNYSFGLDKPILYESDPYKFNVARAPKEQRNEEYIKFLEVSLKIHVKGASGSGTICYYNDKTGVAYVLSCGHLWSGNKDYDENLELPKAKVVSWYKNSKKLDQPEIFEADVLFWSNERGYDVSLLKFKPNWKTNFIPIDTSYSIKKGEILNSMGCDGGSEVARYEVKFIGTYDMDINTKKNSPRPGRSGGGLITDCGKLVGVCWGTSDVSSGNGTGYFTPASSIKKVFVKNKHGWLLNFLGFRLIPIIDIENPSFKYKPEFIPCPILGNQ